MVKGLEGDQEAVNNTPLRVALAYQELFSGYTLEPAEQLGKEFDVVASNDLVIVKNIPFHSMCKHHILPFFGTISVGYLPDTKVVGLSKIPRLIKCLSQRLQIQEGLGRNICDTMMASNLKPKGVITVISAQHLCMQMRGIQSIGAVTTTASLAGVFTENSDLKREFYHLIKE